MNRSSFTASLAFAGTLLCTAAQAVPQAFVASSGDDRNTRRDCPAERPCRTFAAALTVVSSGGEVVAMDAADYGVVTITQSVALVGSGNAGISQFSVAGPAVTIATPGIDVVLRGLSINGGNVGFLGVHMTDGSSLAVENCVVSNFSIGVAVRTAAKVRIANSILRGNSTGVEIRAGASAEVVGTQLVRNSGVGILVDANTAGTTSASITESAASGSLRGFDASSSHAAGIGRMSVIRSTASHNSIAGFHVSASAGSAVMTVANSMSSGNGIGFAQTPGVAGISTFETLGNNAVRQNGAATAGIITPVPEM